MTLEVEKQNLNDVWNNWSKATQFFETSFRAMYEAVYTKEEIDEFIKASTDAMASVNRLNKVASGMAIKAMTPSGMLDGNY